MVEHAKGQPAPNPFSLAGRRAVVTGVSQGIGAAIAAGLARAGADVAGIHLGDASEGAAVERAIRAAGRRALIVQGDHLRPPRRNLALRYRAVGPVARWAAAGAIARPRRAVVPVAAPPRRRRWPFSRGAAGRGRRRSW